MGARLANSMTQPGGRDTGGNSPLVATATQTGGPALVATGGPVSGPAIVANGTGTGSGVNATGGATGKAIAATGGATSGEAVVLTAGIATQCPLRIVPQADPTGGTITHAVGHLYVTAAGVLMICTVAGAPGTFVAVGSQS